MTLLLAATVPMRLLHLAPVDIVIVVLYFVLVLSIGGYLKELSSKTKDKQ
jgi:hypothetical protein